MKPRKIVIKHYLNTKLKAKTDGYKVYVRITYNRINQRRCSEIKQRFHNLETLHKVAYTEIEAEIIKITDFVKIQLLADKDFSLKVPIDVLVKRKKSIIKSLENQLKKHKTELIDLGQYDLFKAKN